MLSCFPYFSRSMPVPPPFLPSCDNLSLGLYDGLPTLHGHVAVADALMARTARHEHLQCVVPKTTKAESIYSQCCTECGYRQSTLSGAHYCQMCSVTRGMPRSYQTSYSTLSDPCRSSPVTTAGWCQAEDSICDQAGGQGNRPSP